MSNPIDPKALAEAKMLYRSFGFDEHVLVGALAAVFEQRDTLTAQVETLKGLLAGSEAQCAQQLKDLAEAYADAESAESKVAALLERKP